MRWLPRFSPGHRTFFFWHPDFQVRVSEAFGLSASGTRPRVVAILAARQQCDGDGISMPAALFR